MLVELMNFTGSSDICLNLFPPNELFITGRRLELKGDFFRNLVQYISYSIILHNTCTHI